MSSTVKVKVTCDEGYTADFLRELAIQIEERKRGDFDYETAHGYAEVEYD